MNTAKKNNIFQYLKCLAIIMVIDDHCSTRIGLLSSLFPYNSFYMPMFVFISGYFYREEPVVKGIKHRAKNLLLPYIAWAFFGLILAYGLEKLCGVVWYRSPFTLNSILKLLFSDPFSGLTEPSWFALMLFWVSVLYNIFSRVRSLATKQSDYLFCAVFTLAGFVCLLYCMRKYLYGWRLFCVRTLWYIQFYHLGVMFKKYLEKAILKVKPYIIIACCIIINVILIVTQPTISFVTTKAMGSFYSWWTPLLTSITGTLFWYEIMKAVSEKFGTSKAVDFVANNTFTIMSCHMVFINIPNFYAYYQRLSGNVRFSDFNTEEFIHNAGIRFSNNTRLVGFFCGLIGSLLTVYLIAKLKEIFSKPVVKTIED